MDYTRREDIEQLKRVINDYSKPRIERERAQDALNTIMRQMEQRDVSDTREQLIRAARAGDTKAMERITERLSNEL